MCDIQVDRAAEVTVYMIYRFQCLLWWISKKLFEFEVTTAISGRVMIASHIRYPTHFLIPLPRVMRAFVFLRGNDEL